MSYHEVTVQDAISVVIGKRHVDTTLAFRLTQEEYNNLEADAEKEGCTISRLLHKLIKDQGALSEKKDRLHEKTLKALFRS